MDTDPVVLIAVLKNKKDLNILLKKHWYRIPVSNSPRKKAEYIAFYQPALFGKNGSCISYYGKIKNISIFKRKEILPSECGHHKADNNYYKMEVSDIKKLPKPVKNKHKMRISFGFTCLDKLMKAESINQLFDVMPIESILAENLDKNKINASREHIFFLPDKKIYRLDFAVFCKKGPLNIECDGEKWHSVRSQRLKDAKRDKILRNYGWKVLRLKEKDIVNNIDNCMNKISGSIKGLGGLSCKDNYCKER